MIYTPDVQAAVHSIPNPTSIPVDIAQKGDMLFLLVDNNKYQQLEPRERKNFRAYLRQMVRTIEIAGVRVQVSRLQEPR